MRHATLNVLQGPLKGQSLPLTNHETLIGRDGECPVLLSDYTRVSRRHARLSWDGQAFKIEDLGSTNGVVVDGQKVQTARLAAGSQVQLGDFSAELWLPSGTPQFGEAAATGGGGKAVTALRNGANRVAGIAVAGWNRLPGNTPVRSAIVAAVAAILYFGTTTSVRRTADAKVEKALTVDPPKSTVKIPLATPIPNQVIEPSKPVDGKISPDAVKSAKEATVLVAFQSGNKFSTGSGFVAGDGRTVVTNRHVVVDDNDRIMPCIIIFHCGTDRQVKVQVAADSIRLAPQSTGKEDFSDDLAVITLDQPIVPALPLGRSEELVEPDTVYAIGFPLGLQTLTLNDQLPSVSVKALSVERAQTGKVNGTDATTVLQLGGTVTHGNSGGPVVNNKGEVVGVISRGAEGTGMSYAIPNAFVKPLLGIKE